MALRLGWGRSGSTQKRLVPQPGAGIGVSADSEAVEAHIGRAVTSRMADSPRGPTITHMFAGLENPLHILLLLLLLLVLFGAKRLPEMGRSLGTGMREFKDSLTKQSTEDSPPAQELPPVGNQSSKRS